MLQKETRPLAGRPSRGRYGCEAISPSKKTRCREPPAQIGGRARVAGSPGGGGARSATRRSGSTETRALSGNEGNQIRGCSGLGVLRARGADRRGWAGPRSCAVSRNPLEEGAQLRRREKRLESLVFSPCSAAAPRVGGVPPLRLCCAGVKAGRGGRLPRARVA